MPTGSANLFSEFKTKGGTLYTFHQGTDQMMRQMTSDAIKFAPSKFVCLKLPDWKNVVGEQSLFIDGADLGNPISTDPNLLFPKMMQNYMENFQVYSANDRSDTNFSTVVETSFWKMLSELGGINFEPDSILNEGGDMLQIYGEGDAGDLTYESVIQYVGDINLINFLVHGGQTYMEVYCHIPTPSGKHIDVLFRPNDLEHNFAAIPDGGGQTETVGLEDFDSDQNLAQYDTIDSKYNVGDDLNKVKLWFDDIENQPSKADQGDYEFNAVLLYYDIWDDGDEANTKRRNLLGILVLDRFEEQGGGINSIPTLTKYQPDSTQPGNAHGIRFNFAFNAASKQVSSEITIDSANTIAMELYETALQRLIVLIDQHTDIQNQLNIVTQEINTLKSYLVGLDTIVNLNNQVETNTNTLNGHTISIADLLARVDALETIVNP